MSSSDKIKSEIVAWVQAAPLATLPNPNPNMNFYSDGEKASHWKRRSKVARPDGTVERVFELQHGTVERVFELQHGSKEIKPGMVLRAIPDALRTVEHPDGTITITPITSSQAVDSDGYRPYWA